jgi:hypothetical protein
MDALDRQARTAGWLYLLLVIPGPFVHIYLPSKLIVRGDAAATAANLLAHEKLFRFGMVADVAGSVFFLAPTCTGPGAAGESSEILFLSMRRCAHP